MRSNYVSTDQAFCPQSQRFELGRDQVQGESIELVTFDIKLPLRQTARVLVRPCSGSTKFWFDRVLVRPCSGSLALTVNRSQAKRLRKENRPSKIQVTSR